MNFGSFEREQMLPVTILADRYRRRISVTLQLWPFAAHALGFCFATYPRACPAKSNVRNATFAHDLIMQLFRYYNLLCMDRVE
ncbi:hypothetical protein Mapa_013465 [Marchantia paleacea]|nr:hypothetical protein Mapa_013465 [Marchantia paleacea]